MSGNRSKSAFFEWRWVTLSADFRGKGAWPTNHCWCQKTRVIAVSCSIKIFAVRCLVFSQYTHLTDRQTDGQTELRQQYHALHYMQSHGKNGRLGLYGAEHSKCNHMMTLGSKGLKCYGSSLNNKVPRPLFVSITHH